MGPEWYDRAIAARLQAVRGALRELQADLGHLQDARTRVPFLNRLQIDDPDEAIDPFEEMLLQQTLAEAMAPPSPRAAGRRRRRR